MRWAGVHMVLSMEPQQKHKAIRQYWCEERVFCGDILFKWYHLEKFPWKKSNQKKKWKYELHEDLITLWFTWLRTGKFAKCQKIKENRALPQNLVRLLWAFARCTSSPPQSGYQSKTPVGPISDSKSRLPIDLQCWDSRTNVNLVPKKDSLPRGGGREKKVTNWVWKW